MWDGLVALLGRNDFLYRGLQAVFPGRDGPHRRPRRAAWVQSGVWVWSQSRKVASSARERGRTVMNRPPRPAMWPIAAREHSLESAIQKVVAAQQRDQPVPHSCLEAPNWHATP